MLKVSDPSLPLDYIEDLEISDRFLKIPIQNYLKLLNITPNRVQNAIINAVNSKDYRFITACVSRRVGKTYISNIILQIVALFPGTTCLIISPDYSLSSISWDLQRELIDKFGLETIRNNAKDRIIELPNNSIIKVASVAKADSAVGRSYDIIIFDEAALNEGGKTAFNIALRPTLDKPDSKCIFISTPRGDNWFKEFFDRGTSTADEHAEWLSIHADYKENPRASEKDIAEAKKNMSNAEFEQEYLANFVTFEGQVWNFNSESIMDLTDMMMDMSNRNLEIIAGLDVGFRDQTALVILAVDEDEEGNNIYYLIDEYVATTKSTAVHAERIKELIDKWDIDSIFIDGAAAQTRYDLAVTYDITTTNAIKSKNDGIGSVGAVIDNDRLFVDEMCTESIYALRNYRWKGTSTDGEWNIESEKTAPGRAAHCADAIRYAIYTYERSIGGIT